MNKIYIKTANNLINRLMNEADEETEYVDSEEELDDNEEPIDDETESEYGQSDQVEVYFNNLNGDTQKLLLSALKEALNVTDDDKYAERKIIDSMKTKPLVTFRGTELSRILNINI